MRPTAPPKAPTQTSAIRPILALGVTLVAIVVIANFSLRPGTASELAAPDLRSPELARGFAVVLDHRAAPEAVKPANVPTEDEPVDYSGLPFEKPSEPPTDDAPGTVNMGRSTRDYLTSNAQAALERALGLKERLMRAERAGRTAEVERLRAELQATREHAQRFTDQLRELER